MNFGSKHVFAYDRSDEESLSETELEQGMWLSASDDDDDDDEAHGITSAPDAVEGEKPPPLPPRPPKKQLGGTRRHQRVNWAPRDRPTAVGRRHVRRADTNVLCVKFDKLKHPSHMHTGDAVVCGKCNAVLSHLSRLTNQGDEKHWICEFCNNEHSIDVVPEEVPRDEDITYMLEPFSLTTEGKPATAGPLDESLMIFCVDISGSMCVTTEVQGRFHLRGEERNRAQQLRDEGIFGVQMADQRRDVTYVSRLQGVQAAIDHQLETMRNSHPNMAVALVTFSNEVTVLGDGSGTPLVIAGDKMADKDELMRLGSEANLPQKVGHMGKSLSEKVFSLEGGGSTALGPALLFSIMMASQKAASKVIICTDGLANVGLGSLDGFYTDEQQEEAQKFYDELAQLAQEKGVLVSVVTIEGTECRVAELGQVADKTGGQVSIVDPLKLTQEFGNMLANPIIATGVSATLILHSGLYFRNEETQGSQLTQQIGNVTADTEITFEFGVRTSKLCTPEPEQPNPEVKEEKEKEGATALPDIVVTGESGDAPAAGEGGGGAPRLGGLKELPFQLQIKYTSMDGAKSLRVISKSQPVTKSREVAEREMNIGVVGAHCAQSSARLAIEGDYGRSRITSMMNQRLVQRWSHSTGNRDDYVNWFSNMAPMEVDLRDAQQRERVTLGRCRSDEEEEFNGSQLETAPMAAQALPVAPRKLKKQKARRKECSDRSANLLFNMKAARSTTFSELPTRPEEGRSEKDSKTE
eukprot:m.308356 g.308356  ORF g.308356 m.308356 type:complete len:751 (+) comp43845_c0_seq1:107-2359(+)